MARVSTPCVNFCILDPAHGLCEGCGRTSEEIAKWCFISEAERLAIMAELKERLSRALAAQKAAVPAIRPA